MSSTVFPPYPIFTDTDGSPLEDGYVYIGETYQNAETHPVETYWDNQLTVVAGQPIRTIGGYPARAGTPSQVYVYEDNYSIVVRNKHGELVVTAPSSQYVFPYAVGSYQLAYPNTVNRTIIGRFAERVSALDFGVVGDGATDDTTKLQNALTHVQNYGGLLWFPDGMIVKITGAVSMTLTAASGIVGNATILEDYTNGNAFVVYPAGYDFYVGGGLCFDGNSKAARLLEINQSTEGSNRITVERAEFKNAYNTLAFPYASIGLHCRGGMREVRLLQSNFHDMNRAEGIDSGTVGASVVSLSGYSPENVIVDGCTFKNITNSETSGTAYNKDTDGLQVFCNLQSGTFMAQNAVICNTKFHNCKIRAIKVQNDKTVVSDCHVYRNVSGGSLNSEINLQVGAGQVNHVVMHYEDSASGEATMVRPLLPVSFYTGADYSLPRAYSVTGLRVYSEVTTGGNLSRVVDATAGGTWTNDVFLNITNIFVEAKSEAFVGVSPVSSPARGILTLDHIYVKELMEGVVAVHADSSQTVCCIHNIHNDGPTDVKPVWHILGGYGNVWVKMGGWVKGVESPRIVGHIRANFYESGLTGVGDNKGTTLGVYGVECYSFNLGDDASDTTTMTNCYSVFVIINCTFDRHSNGAFVALGMGGTLGVTPVAETGSTRFACGESTNPDIDGKINLWMTGSTLSIKNRLGSTRTFTITIFGK